MTAAGATTESDVRVRFDAGAGGFPPALAVKVHPAATVDYFLERFAALGTLALSRDLRRPDTGRAAFTVAELAALTPEQLQQLVELWRRAQLGDEIPELLTKICSRGAGREFARVLECAPERYAWLNLARVAHEVDVEKLRARISYRQLREWEHLNAFENAIKLAALEPDQVPQRLEDLPEINPKVLHDLLEKTYGAK